MFLVPFFRENKHSLFLLVWMTIMPIVCSAIVTLLAIKYEVYIRSFNLPAWLIFFTGATITMALAMTPTTFIALLSGFFLSWLAVPFMLISYLVASALGFFLAKRVDQGKFLASIRKLPKVAGFINAINSKQLSFIVLCRISPVLPFAIMNVVLSMIHISFSKFLWGGFLGMLPRTLLFIWIGSTLHQLREIVETGRADASQISFFTLLTISVVGFYLYFKNLISKKITEKGHSNEI